MYNIRRPRRLCCRYLLRILCEEAPNIDGVKVLRRILSRDISYPHHYLAQAPGDSTKFTLLGCAAISQQLYLLLEALCRSRCTTPEPRLTLMTTIRKVSPRAVRIYGSPAHYAGPGQRTEQSFMIIGELYKRRIPLPLW